MRGLHVQNDEIIIEPYAPIAFRAKVLNFLLLSPGALSSRGRKNKIGPNVSIHIEFKDKQTATRARLKVLRAIVEGEIA